MTIFFISLLSLVAALFSSQPAFAQSLSSTEQTIRQVIIENKKSELSLLEKIVNINSGTLNTLGVYQVGELLRPEFQQMGFTTRWAKEPDNLHRTGILFAERLGTKGKRLLLIGHLDTVFAKNSPFQQFKLLDNFATGPGVIDAKGGDMVILFALKALYRAHALDGTTITVALVGDEEDSGKPTALSRKSLLEAAKKSDIALDFEWSFSLDTATIARRGISQWVIETKGKESHSSQIFQKTVGSGAIFELARILNQMRSELANTQYLSFNPGLVLGGTSITTEDNQSGTAQGKQNVIAQMAVASGDLRFLSSAQKKLAEEKIIAIVNQHLPGTTAKIQFEDAIPAMTPTKQNMNLLQQYSEASFDLGYKPVQALNPGSRGAGDISHVAAFVTANLGGLGPVGTGAHSVNEKLDVHSLEIQTERAALLMFRLTH